MEMAFMKQGGIRDDGMTKDPVSGNNVPPGSLAKEVRDDIPAMLSEGEYVVPADVLRFYGVNFFENLRNQAKNGLQNMEQNGRIGGTPMTQQDVARNMQQPMMAPAPVQAAQGTMMESPLRIKQQEAPKAMGNLQTQGFSQGTTDPRAEEYKSGWSAGTARMNTPMFQGTSSQAANLAAATAETAQAAESITYMRTHYDKDGNTAQIQYVGTTPESAVPAKGQDQLLKDYPLTEAEYQAYLAQKGGNGGGSDDPDPTPTGSDTSWMDGINWADKASVKEWVESPDGLGMSEAAKGLAMKGGILGAIPQGVQAQDIAKVRGIRDYYDSIGDKEMVDYLDGQIKTAVDNGGILISALDKLGLITGKNYLEQMKNLDLTTQKNIELGGMSAEEKQALDAKLLQDKEDRQTAAADILTQAQSSAESGSTADIIEESDDPKDTAENLADVLAGLETGAQTGTIQLNEGGLMTAKPKKKRGRPKKSGLAGKK